MENQLLETWNIHNRINLYLLEAISEDALNGISASKGRSVGEQFAHLHNVRLMWLKSGAPDLLETVMKIDKTQKIDKKLLAEALQDSGKAIESLLQWALNPLARSKVSNRTSQPF